MKPEWKVCFRVGVNAFLLFLCIRYWDGFIHLLTLFFTAAMPLFVGCVIAYIINIPMRFYERHCFPDSQKKLVIIFRRPFCMILAFISVVAVILLVIRTVAPEVGKCVSLLLSNVPQMLQSTSDRLSDSSLFSSEVSEVLQTIDWKKSISKLVDFLKNGAGIAAGQIVEWTAGMISIGTNLLIGLIFSIYLLSGKEQLSRQCRILANRYIRADWRDRAAHILTVADDCFHRYITGQCTEAVILGILCAVSMTILGFPYASAVGATIGLTALIPVAGAYIGGAVGFLLILTISPVQSVLFIVYLVILQQVEGNLIYPRVVGTSMGLPGIWVLAAVIVGGGLGGIPGMILGVPFTACLYRLVREDVKGGISKCKPSNCPSAD